MNKLLLILILVPSITFSQSRKQRKAQEKADKILIANLEQHIKYLSDDKLEGRRTGTPGEIMAMNYISGQFKSVGLLPRGTNDYIQEFEINEGKQFSAADNFFTVNNDTLEAGKDFYPLAYSANSAAAGTSSLGLRERGEPWFYDVKFVLDENRNNPHFDIDEAIYNEAKRAAEKGGKALIVFNSSSLVDNIQFNKNDSSQSVQIPVIYLSKEGLQHYFKDATDTYDLSLRVNLVHASRMARNVVGLLNFNAPTTVIIGAHYDHLGYGEDENSLDGIGQIHNGADDNASGTAALIELARLLKNTKSHNNNYLFIAFSGEELGLFGSKYWVSHPTMDIVPNYMVNIDMIGRYDPSRKLSVGGYGTSPLWSTVFTGTTDKNLVIKFDSSGSGPSDHETFYRKNIPVLFFFTNTHSDYHKATDDWDKINFNGEAEIVKYVDQVIEAADNKGKFSFTQTRDPQMGAIYLPVTLGVMPDYSFTGTGLRIDGVSKGKTAEKAGLQAGDVLLQLGDYKFVDIQTYMQALQQFKKGDNTTLRIMRGDKEMRFNIEF